MEATTELEFDFKQIDTFKKVLQCNGESLKQFNLRTLGMAIDTIGYEKVKAIAFALNGGRYVNRGYYPLFYNPTGSSISFSYHGLTFDSSYASVGANLLFAEGNLAIFAGKTFLKEYSQFINGTEE